MNKKISVNKKIIYLLLFMYFFSLIMFDYTIMYIIAFIILFVAKFLLYRKNKIAFSNLFKMYLFLIIYFLIHLLLNFSVNEDYSIQYLKTMILNLAIIFTIDRSIDTKEDLEIALKLYIVASIITCFYIIIDDYNNLLTGNLGIGALKPFFRSKYAHNDVSMAAAYSTMFISYFNLSGKKIKYSLLLTIFFSIFVILTGARKSLILVIFSLIIYPLLFSYKDKDFFKKIMKVLLCILGIIISFIIITKNEVLYNLIGYRFIGFFDGILNGGNYTESSAVSRSIMLKTALNLFLKNPFIGYGLNTFRTFPGSYGTWSHNNYLELAVSGGIFAAIIYYGLFIYIFKKLFKTQKNQMVGMFISIMIFMIIHDFLSISYITRMVLLILGITCSYIKISCNNCKE